MLPNISTIHFVWIGSPLEEEHYKNLSSLCTHLDKTSFSNVEIHIWKDQNLLDEKVFLKKSKLSASCAAKIQVREVQNLFDKYSDIHYSSYRRGIKKRVDLGQLKKIYNYYFEIQKKYELGSLIFSPLADLLKVLIIYREGGIYFDINMDFSDLSFDVPRNFGDASRQLVVNGTKKLNMPEYFSAFDEKMNIYKSFGKLFSVRFYKNRNYFFKKLKYVETSAYQRTGEAFISMDFMASVFRYAEPLNEYLYSLITDFVLVKKEEILNLFLSKGFDSTTWVFSLGGPAFFTKNIITGKDKIGYVKLHTKYLGKKSWKSLGNSLNIFLLHHCFKSFQDPLLEKMAQECWNTNFFLTLLDPDERFRLSQFRLSRDVEACYFSNLKDAFETDSFKATTQEKIQKLADYYPLHFAQMSGEIYFLCHFKLKAQRSDKITFKLDETLNLIECQWGSEKAFITEDELSKSVCDLGF